MPILRVWTEYLGVVMAGTKKACSSEIHIYQRTCAHSWITYFNDRRKLAFQQKGMLAQGNSQNER
ncbi:hypothetical protein FB45DRAFT_889800 [Roridomyces roridus]|uniref:Uncharacterized protein n=1 Tax=Roridomyces roridus TaxID=1738132 RepID=A0AAD7CKI2_9AGAR|nr:hypothetical protein FB45DRAFT_889800 [Roridomyces roridus]